MGIKDDAVEVRAQGWRTLAALHGLIESELERSLQSEAQLSVVEYTVPRPEAATHSRSAAPVPGSAMRG